MKVWKPEDITSGEQACAILDQCKRDLEALVEQVLVENEPKNAVLVEQLLHAIKRGQAIH